MTRRSPQSSKTFVWLNRAVSPPRVRVCLLAHLTTSESLVARVALAAQRHPHAYRENIRHPGHSLHVIPVKGSSDYQERCPTPESSKPRLTRKARTCFRWTTYGMFIYELGLRRKGLYIDWMPARTVHVLFQDTEETASLNTRMDYS
jgi:hypothetical protein